MSKITRYDGRRLRTTTRASAFKEILNRRQRPFAVHYSTPELIYPTISAIKRLTIVKHVWHLGDSLQKLASLYYNEPAFWWIVGWYNKKPTDQHYKSGDVVDVPLPLDEIVDALGA